MAKHSDTLVLTPDRKEEKAEKTRQKHKQVDEEAMRRVLENHRETSAGVILRLAWNMGLSISEMHRLTWSDVSFPEGQIYLPDRSVPMDEDTEQCLRARFEKPYSHFSEHVVISEMRRVHMHRVYISTIAQKALDEGGLPDVTLLDLRYNFIIRQLEQHDWPYVSRVSGFTLTTLRRNFSRYYQGAEKMRAQRSAPGADEAGVRKIAEAEGAPEGLALWLRWKHGFSLTEIVSLTWEQIDLAAGCLQLPERRVPVDDVLERLLRHALAARTPEMDPHVLLTPRSKRPFDVARISRVMRMSLIRGGMESLTLENLVRKRGRDEEETLILRCAEERGSISRNEVMKLLNMTKSLAWERLRQMTEQGDLVKVGTKYYPAGAVVPPERQYEVVRTYLEAEGVAYRKDLAALLNVGLKQCGWILHGMVKEGKLVRTRQHYTLSEESRNAK